MRTLKTLVFISLTFALTQPLLTACSDDDEPTNGTTGTGTGSPSDNMPSETKAFVGAWECNVSGTVDDHSLFLYEDGSCSLNYYSYKGGGTDTWTYDNETKILSSSLIIASYSNRRRPCQYQVTLSSPYDWSCLWLASDDKIALTFNRYDDKQLILAIGASNRRWTNGTDTIDIPYDYGQQITSNAIEIIYGEWREEHKSYDVYWENAFNDDEDDKAYDNKLRYKVGFDYNRGWGDRSYFHIDSGSVVINHPFYPGHTTLEFDGELIKGTFRPVD